MRYRCVVSRRAIWGLLVMCVLLAPSHGMARERIWADAIVSQERPYVQQLVTYIVRVYSRGNLRSIEVSPPNSPGVSLEELEGPLTSTKTLRGRRYIVSEFRYALTPMVEGPIEVGPTRLTVTPTETSGNQYGRGAGPWQQPSRGPARTVKVSTRDVRINVRAPVPGVQPWRPLEFMSIEAHWTNAEKLVVGDPTTLTVTMKALGAKGSQLPSLEPLMETEAFKVYPERPQADWKFGSDGVALWGRRIETYTLVPTRDGQAAFPAVTVPWWNVQARREELAKVPGRVFVVGEGVGGISSASTSGGATWLSSLLSNDAVLNYLLPVGGGLLIAFIFGIWVGTGRPSFGFLRRIRESDAEVDVAEATIPAGVTRDTALRGQMWVQYLREGAQMAVRSVRKLGARTLGWTVGLLPARVKSWWCVRCIGSQQDATGLCQTLRSYACDELSMSPSTPLSTIAERIAQQGPDADGAPLRGLIRELDDATYGAQSIDVTKWKRKFSRRFRRSLSSKKSDKMGSRDMGLPKLNP